VLKSRDLFRSLTSLQGRKTRQGYQAVREILFLRMGAELHLGSAFFIADSAALKRRKGAAA